MNSNKMSVTSYCFVFSRNERTEGKLSSRFGGEIWISGRTALVGSEIFGNELGTHRVTDETQGRRTETNFT